MPLRGQELVPLDYDLLNDLVVVIDEAQPRDVEAACLKDGHRYFVHTLKIYDYSELIIEYLTL